MLERCKCLSVSWLVHLCGLDLNISTTIGYDILIVPRGWTLLSVVIPWLFLYSHNEVTNRSFQLISTTIGYGPLFRHWWSPEDESYSVWWSHNFASSITRRLQIVFFIVKYFNHWMDWHEICFTHWPNCNNCGEQLGFHLAPASGQIIPQFMNNHVKTHFQL